jgi:hypothetical protein
LTPEFLKKFQNSEYEVHQVGSNEAGSQNFSFLALNTAERVAPQIASKNPRQRRGLENHNFLKKTISQKILKKFGKLGKNRYICDILAQEQILKLQYTIYGDFLKKMRNLSHKYYLPKLHVK